MDDTDVTSALKEAIGSVLEEARKVPPVQTQNPTQHVVLHQAEAPKPAPWHAWACVTATIISLMVTAFAMREASEAKDEARALRAELSQRVDSERMSREIMNKWTAQEVTAIRSYITTGKLAPMSSPPVDSKEIP